MDHLFREDNKSINRVTNHARARTHEIFHSIECEEEEN